MKNRRTVKGIIPVALAFVIVISVILVAVTGVFWSKTPLSVSHIKRYHAINYARAALHEAAYRFRTNYVEGALTWDADAWEANGTSGSIFIDGLVEVTISVVDDGGRNKVLAKVNYGDIPL